MHHHFRVFPGAEILRIQARTNYGLFHPLSLFEPKELWHYGEDRVIDMEFVEAADWCRESEYQILCQMYSIKAKCPPLTWYLQLQFYDLRIPTEKFHKFIKFHQCQDIPYPTIMDTQVITITAPKWVSEREVKTFSPTWWASERGL